MLVKKWHPDHHHSEPYENRALAEKKFREIDEAYRRISGRWKKTARPGRFSKIATAPGTSPFHDSHRPGAKPRTNPSALSRVKIGIQIVSKTRIILPALLLLAATAFIFTQFTSFSPNRAVDTETKESLESPVSGYNASGAPSGLGGPLSHRRPGSGETIDERPEDSSQSPVSVLNSSGASRGQRGLFSEDRPNHGPGGAIDPFLNFTPDLLNLQPRATSSFFTLGSTSSEVLAVQGTPSRVQGQTWTYGLSEVEFRNGRVSRFNNFDGSLRVNMQPEGPEGGVQPDHITIGSSEQQVLAVQGTPTRVEGNKWFYGFAEIVFKNGRIAEYDNYFGALKMRIVPSQSDSKPSKDVFTIGSSPDEVLAVQGTPTAIHGNRWSFDFASVVFREGKVHSVTDAGGTLRFSAPQ